jgi:glc operon protein GlcG
MRTLAFAVCLMALTADAANGEPTMKRVLTLADAEHVIAAAKSQAEKSKAPCVIAVVDDGGWLIAFERMDDVPMLASVELAPGKARASAMFRKPTADLEKAINAGRTAAVTARGYIEMQGGIPISLGGKVIGAVGISADTPEHDQEIAKAAADSLEEQ